jgi:hypothetical protein
MLKRPVFPKWTIYLLAAARNGKPGDVRRAGGFRILKLHKLARLLKDFVGIRKQIRLTSDKSLVIPVLACVLEI